MSEKLFSDILDCYASGFLIPLLDSQDKSTLAVNEAGGTTIFPKTYAGVVPENCPLMIPPYNSIPRTVSSFAVCMECTFATQI